MAPRSLTLPLLQMQLDQLVPDRGLHLPLAEVERIFGLNDVASGHIKNFANATTAPLHGWALACSF